MAALSRIANSSHPQVQPRARRHRPAGVVADPGQRERDLPRHRRADQARAPTSCTRATPWSTSRATPRPASCSTATTSSSRPTCCRCTARSATCTPTRRSRTADGRAERDPRRGRLRHRPRRRPRLDRRRRTTCGYVYVDGSSVGDLTDSELKDRRIAGRRGLHLGRRRRSTPPPARSSRGPEIHARGLAEDDSVFDEIAAQDRRRPRGGARRRCTRHRQLAAGHAPRPRVVRRPSTASPPDDHPHRPGGLRVASGSRYPTSPAP